MKSIENQAQNKEYIPRGKSVYEWCIHFYDTVDSTNNVARSLQPWSAVLANTQMAGRGRHGRLWVSDCGGLWLSMVVPIAGKRCRWEALPLAAGWAIVKVIRNFGIQEVRLRWPNDILVKDKKLAGVLVEQFSESVAVVGVGINVLNNPDRIDYKLTHTIARLSDLIYPAPGLNELTELLLKAFGTIHQQMEWSGFDAISSKVNAAWGKPCRVELELKNGIQRGLFIGVNQRGDLIIKSDSYHTYTYSPCQVKLFREI